MVRSFKIILLLLAPVLFLFQGCYPARLPSQKKAPEPSAFRYYENALVAKFDGHWQTALKKINKAIELNNRISLFYVLKAQIFDSLHQVDSAIIAYQQALKVRPHAPDVLQKIGELYIKNGDHISGIAYLKKAFAFDETQTDILLRIAHLYIQLDSLQLARDVLTDYKIRMDLAHSPPAPAYFLMKGDMAIAQGDSSKAAQYYESCPCKKCFSKEQAIRAFETLFKVKDYDGYFALLTGVDEHKFRHGELFYYRGLYYRVIGNKNEAQHQFELALKHGNTKPELYLELAKIYFQKNQPDKVKALYQQLKAIEPKSPYLSQIRAMF